MSLARSRETSRPRCRYGIAHAPGIGPSLGHRPGTTVYARAGAYASGVELVLRSRQFLTFAFNSSNQFSTTISSPPPVMSAGPTNTKR